MVEKKKTEKVAKVKRKVESKSPSAEKKTESKTAIPKPTINPKKETASSKNKKPLNFGLALRGRVFTGIVISDKMMKTVTVSWPRQVYVPKYERNEKRRSTVKAHNPPEINAKVGDVVRIAECRPISKTKKFIVFEKISSSGDTR